jgi:hypothetical protein
MSLSTSAPRRHLHTRTIACEGYEREDGLFDIEARIVDTKTYAVTEPYRGLRQPGEHVHDMQLRLTLDRDMVVRDIEVATNHAPYDPCFTVAAAYKGLVGAKIGGGWRRAVNEAVGGTKGCTHLGASHARSDGCVPDYGQLAQGGQGRHRGGARQGPEETLLHRRLQGLGFERPGGRAAVSAALPQVGLNGEESQPLVAEVQLAAGPGIRRRVRDLRG